MTRETWLYWRLSPEDTIHHGRLLWIVAAQHGEIIAVIVGDHGHLHAVPIDFCQVDEHRR